MEALRERVSHLWAYVTGTQPEPEFRVGKYTADYSSVPPELIQAEDPALKDLYANSKPVSRDR